LNGQEVSVDLGEVDPLGKADPDWRVRERDVTAPCARRNEIVIYTREQRSARAWVARGTGPAR
jgi:hypothetical protein